MTNQPKLILNLEAFLLAKELRKYHKGSLDPLFDTIFELEQIAEDGHSGNTFMKLSVEENIADGYRALEIRKERAR